MMRKSPIEKLCLATLLVLPAMAACGPEDPGAGAGDADLALAATATQGSEAALSVAEPFAGELNQRPRDRLGDGELRDRIAAAIAVWGERADQRCVSVEWAELTATVTFDQCVSPNSGHSIDGSVTLVAAPAPDRALSISFEALSIDACVATGHLDLAASGEVPASAIQIEAQLAVDCADPAYALELSGIRSASAESVQLEGAAALTQDGVTQSFSLDAVVRTRGDCLPSSGSFTYTTERGVPVVITFLEQTPETGVVLVKLGPLSANEEAMFQACPELPALQP